MNWRWLMLVAVALPLSSMAGCIQNMHQETAWQRIERKEWLPGYEWTYVSGNRSGPFTTKVIANVADYGPAYLVEWKNDAVDRLVSVSEGLLRHQSWADPLWIDCVARPCLGPPNIRYEDQSVVNTGQIIPRTFTSSPSIPSDVGFIKMPAWVYNDTVVAVEGTVNAEGPMTYDSPYLGSVSVIRMVYHFTGTDTKPLVGLRETAARPVNFTVAAEWGIGQLNFVHAHAMGGDGPAQGFGAGFLFGNGPATQSEYWLSSYSLRPGQALSPQEIDVRWGGRVGPGHFNKFTLHLFYGPTNVTVENGPSSVGYSILLDHGAFATYPAQDTLYYSLKDGFGNVFLKKTITGNEFPGARGGNQWQFPIIFAKPGYYSLEAIANRSNGEPWDQKQWKIEVGLRGQAVFPCPNIAAPASTMTCNEITFPAGQSKELVLGLSNLAPGNSRIMVRDANGHSVLDEKISGSSWSRTVELLPTFNLMNNWTAAWEPEYAAANSQVSFTYYWAP